MGVGRGHAPLIHEKDSGKILEIQKRKQKKIIKNRKRDKMRKVVIVGYEKFQKRKENQENEGENEGKRHEKRKKDLKLLATLLA